MPVRAQLVPGEASATWLVAIAAQLGSRALAACPLYPLCPALLAVSMAPLMQWEMPLQGVFARECAPAVGAGEGPLAQMPRPVPQEVLGSAKGRAAFAADMASHDG